MTRGGLIQQLRSGRTADHRYARGPLRGLVSAWLHEGKFVLTWEESGGGQTGTAKPASGRTPTTGGDRDERHLFATAEELVAFVEQRGLTAEDFRV